MMAVVVMAMLKLESLPAGKPRVGTWMAQRTRWLSDCPVPNEQAAAGNPTAASRPYHHNYPFPKLALYALTLVFRI